MNSIMKIYYSEIRRNRKNIFSVIFLSNLILFVSIMYNVKELKLAYISLIAKEAFLKSNKFIHYYYFGGGIPKATFLSAFGKNEVFIILFSVIICVIMASIFIIEDFSIKNKSIIFYDLLPIKKTNIYIGKFLAGVSVVYIYIIVLSVNLFFLDFLISKIEGDIYVFTGAFSSLINYNSMFIPNSIKMFFNIYVFLLFSLVFFVQTITSILYTGFRKMAVLYKFMYIILLILGIFIFVMMALFSVTGFLDYLEIFVPAKNMILYGRCFYVLCALLDIIILMIFNINMKNRFK